MTKRLSVKMLLWWVGCSFLLLIVGSLFLGSLLTDGFVAVVLMLPHGSQDESSDAPVLSALGVFSLLMTTIWAHLSLGLVNRMRKRRGRAELRPIARVVEFSGLTGSAAAFVAVLPLFCGLIHGVAYQGAIEKKQQMEWQQQVAQRSEETDRQQRLQKSVEEETRRSKLRPTITARPVNLQTLPLETTMP